MKINLQTLKFEAKQELKDYVNDKLLLILFQAIPGGEFHKYLSGN